MCGGSLILLPALTVLFLCCVALSYFNITFALSLFNCLLDLKPFSFLMGDRRRNNLEEDELGEVKRGETITKICCVRKESIFNKLIIQVITKVS